MKGWKIGLWVAQGLLAVAFTGAVKLIGAVELVMKILPILTPVAAVGLALTMVGAAVTHLRIGEPPIPNVVLGALAVFVAWGRFKRAPIAA